MWKCHLHYMERGAFVQFFQIVLLIVAISLEVYSYSIDERWREVIRTIKLPEKNMEPAAFVCPWLIDKLDPVAYAKMRKELMESDEWDMQTQKAKDLPKGHIRLSDIKHLKKVIPRTSPEEVAAICLMILSAVMLIGHLILACGSTNYEWRTKWTGGVQGTIMFLLGFAGIFLAISAHRNDDNYKEIAGKFKECKVLQFCTERKVLKGAANTTKRIENHLRSIGLSKSDKTIATFSKLYFMDGMCQTFDFKIAAAIIVGIQIIVAAIIIAHAMTLSTIYDEEDVDEEEKARREMFHHHALHVKRRMHKEARNRTKALNNSDKKQQKEK